LDKPLHVIYKVSKLAYRISVILIANKRVKKKFILLTSLAFRDVSVNVQHTGLTICDLFFLSLTAEISFGDAFLGKLLPLEFDNLGMGE
jgi:hypothetical protein